MRRPLHSYGTKSQSSLSLKRTCHPKPLSVCAEDTELVSTESFRPIFTLFHILLLAKHRCRYFPGQGTCSSRIRHQFHVVDVSTTFPPVSVTSAENSGRIFRNFPKIFGNRLRVHIGTPVVDHQIFEVLEEPFVWYERPLSAGPSRRSTMDA